MPTIAEIADGVRLKAAHQVLEHRLAELRAVGNGFHQRYADVLRSDQTEGRKQKAMLALQAEDAENNTKIRECRIELEPHRAAHARRVAEALRDRQEAAAARIVAAIDDATAAAREFNDVQQALRRWGADAPTLHLPRPTPPVGFRLAPKAGRRGGTE